MNPDDLFSFTQLPPEQQGVLAPEQRGLFAQQGTPRRKRRNLLGRLWENIKEAGTSMPHELEAQFAPEELERMRSAAFWSGGGRNSMKEQMGTLLSMRAAKQREGVRAQVLSKYRPSPNETPQQAAQRLQQLFQELVVVGDDELAGKVGEVLKAQTDLLSPQGGKPNNLQQFDVGDRVILRDPVTGQERIEHKGPVPRAPETPNERAARLMTLINPATGLPELAEYKDGGFHFTGMTPGTARESAATEGERKAGVLLTLTQDAIDFLDNATAPGRLAQLMGRNGLNEFLPAERQQINQAGFLVADAYVRLTSGANAPEPEVERAFRAITPQPGDSPELLARKAATRKRFVMALKMAAGRAGRMVQPGETPAATTKGKNPLLP